MEVLMDYHTMAQWHLHQRMFEPPVTVGWLRAHCLLAALWKGNLLYRGVLLWSFTRRSINPHQNPSSRTCLTCDEWIRAGNKMVPHSVLTWSRSKDCGHHGWITTFWENFIESKRPLVTRVQCTLLPPSSLIKLHYPCYETLLPNPQPVHGHSSK